MNIAFQGLNDKQAVAVAELSDQLGFQISDGASTVVSVTAGNYLSLSGTPDHVAVTYHTPHEFFRALSYLPGFFKDGKEIRETGAYKMLCYMADNSRNAVYNLPTAKRVIRYLALMGYNAMMLYTEDTYELPEYPYFGHMRGRFSEEELKDRKSVV